MTRQTDILLIDDVLVREALGWAPVAGGKCDVVPTVSNLTFLESKIMNPISIASQPTTNRSLRLSAARLITVPLLVLIGILNLFLTVSLEAARPKPPLAPSNLTASAVSSSQINLSWVDNSGNESGFIIQRGPSATGPWMQIGTTGVNVTSYANSGMSAGSTYHYRVCAYNSRGNSSFSGTASATTSQSVDTTAPSIPSGLTASAASSSQINLSWSAATDTGGSGLAGYKVYRNGTQIGTTTTPSYSNTGLAASTTYSYTVAAYDAAGNNSAQSGQAFATTTAAPDTSAPSIPAGLTASAASSSQINLSWSAATDTGGSGLAGYKVYRNGVQIGTTTTISYSSAGLAASTTYCYTVAAYDGAGNSSTPGTQVCAATAANCTYSLSSSSASVGAGGSSGSVTVNGTTGCGWMAIVNSSGSGWISITSGSAGSGNGTVYYTVAGNTTTSARTGTMTIAGQTFSVSQAAGTDNPPTASLTAPTSGATLTGTATFNATASDDVGVARVEFWRDGTVLLGTDTTAPYSLSYNTASIPNGSHTFTCKAYDTAGHSTTSPAITATVNNSTTSGPGQFEWSLALGGTDYDYGWSVAVDRRTSDVILAGSFGGPVDFGGGVLSNYTGSNLLLAKYNESGEYLWAKSFQGPGSGRPLAVAVDSMGNIFVTGWFTSTLDFGGGPLSSGGTADPDIFLAKYSSAGIHLWSKRFGSRETTVTLDPVEAGRAIAVDPNGDVVFGGSFLGTIDFGGGLMTSVGDIGYKDGFLAKFSGSTGTHLWSKRLGEGGQNDAVTAVAVDANGNIVATGGFVGTANFGGGALTAVSQDVFVAKYSPSGAHLWSKRFGGTLNDIANSVAVDSSGNVVIIGNFGFSVDFGGGPLIGSDAQDIFVAKLSASGVHVWSKRFGGTLPYDCGNSVAVDATGNVLITGNFIGPADFGGGAKSSQGWDVFVAKYSPTGAHVWSKQIGGSNIDEGVSIAVDGAGNSVITGRFNETVDFGGGGMTSAGRGDIFVVKYAP